MNPASDLIRQQREVWESPKGIRMRKELSARPGWAVHFQGVDLLLGGDLDGALQFFRESLLAFTAANDRRGVEMATTAIQQILQGKRLIESVGRPLGWSDDGLANFRQTSSPPWKEELPWLTDAAMQKRQLDRELEQKRLDADLERRRLEQEVEDLKRKKRRLQ
jgi:hypothetical protein